MKDSPDLKHDRSQLYPSVPSPITTCLRQRPKCGPLREPTYENNVETVFGITAVMQLEPRNLSRVAEGVRPKGLFELRQ